MSEKVQQSAEPPSEGSVSTGRDGAFGWRVLVSEFAPLIASVLVFGAGLALLISASQPALPDRLTSLLEAWRLELVELSHLMASVVGVLLLFISGGLWRRRYSPIFSKLGSGVYTWGEEIYGFKGLRAYKAKFLANWKPVFIAAPPHVSLPVSLMDAALLTSGGILGALRSK